MKYLSHSNRRASLSPLVAAIRHIQQGNRLQRTTGEQLADAQASDSEAPPSSPTPAAGRRNSMFASALAGLDARRRSAAMGSPQVVPDTSLGSQPPSPTNNPIITVVTPTTPTSPASSTSSFVQSPQQAQSDASPSGQLRRPFAQAPRQAPQQPRSPPSDQPAAPAPAKPSAIVTHAPPSPTAQPARERQGSDPLQRSQTLRNGRPPPLRASDFEQTESDDEEEEEEEEEDSANDTQEHDDETSDDEV